MQAPAQRGPLAKITASALLAESALALLLWPVYVLADHRPLALGLALALLNALPLAALSGLLTAGILWARRGRR